jgi:glycine/D-amino acid oxidase-like deaminating enzyme
MPENHPLLLECKRLDAYQLKTVEDFVAGAGYERQRQGRVLIDGPGSVAPEYAEREVEELRKRKHMFRAIVLVFAILTAAALIYSWHGAQSYGLELAEYELQRGVE